ncbi:rod shape-determining protein MreD [Clostridium algifaecis]|uniref:Rod shape-determining protein MreD n=1 Tax=Clostridium algifaecis TaxID=1472040 RepID=A0ABS4KSI5_9CLOT|nr:rod shape-determining protein MreD [Clostridium algifaecis]MBP2032992.1 rod shape-determining protein MreD [Clostridium algifaecis]
MKKILMLILISILLFILDNVFVPFFPIRNIYPSLLFVFIVCYSIASGSWEGLWLGVFAGILQDIYFIDGFWINTFLNMIICVIAGILGNSIFKEKKFIPIIFCFLLANLKGLLLFFTLNLSGIYSDITNMFFISIYDMIICIFMYKTVYKFSKKNYMESKWKF